MRRWPSPWLLMKEWPISIAEAMSRTEIMAKAVLPSPMITSASCRSSFTKIQNLNKQISQVPFRVNGQFAICQFSPSPAMSVPRSWSESSYRCVHHSYTPELKWFLAFLSDRVPMRAPRGSFCTFHNDFLNMPTDAMRWNVGMRAWNGSMFLNS